MEIIDDSVDLDHKIIVKEFVQQVMNMVSKRDQRVLYKHFFEGCTLKDIGDELGVTVARVRQIKERALAKIKKGVGDGLVGNF